MCAAMILIAAKKLIGSLSQRVAIPIKGLILPKNLSTKFRCLYTQELKANDFLRFRLGGILAQDFYFSAKARKALVS
jgi:hypothetical protein